MSRFVYAAFALVVAAQIAIHGPRLPRPGLLLVYAAIVSIVLGLFALLPPMLRRLPPALVNIPHRDYWLAPERKEATLAAVTKLVHLFAAATAAFTVGMFELVFRANEALRSRLFFPALLLSAYFAFVVAWVTIFVLRFRARTP